MSSNRQRLSPKPTAEKRPSRESLANKSQTEVQVESREQIGSRSGMNSTDYPSRYSSKNKSTNENYLNEVEVPQGPSRGSSSKAASLTSAGQSQHHATSTFIR